MICVHPITRAMILEEKTELTPPWGHVCGMYGIRHRKYPVTMWLDIFDEIGGIGYVSVADNKVIAQMIVLPKKYARRIGLSTSKTLEDMDTTMVIGCLYVAQEHRNRGVASSMIRQLILFCREKEYNRIEVPIDLRLPDEAGINISFFPFQKFNFVVEELNEAWECRPETRMAFLQL